MLYLGHDGPSACTCQSSRVCDFCITWSFLQCTSSILVLLYWFVCALYMYAWFEQLMVFFVLCMWWLVCILFYMYGINCLVRCIYDLYAWYAYVLFICLYFVYVWLCECFVYVLRLICAILHVDFIFCLLQSLFLLLLFPLHIYYVSE